MCGCAQVCVCVQWHVWMCSWVCSCVYVHVADNEGGKGEVGLQWYEAEQNGVSICGSFPATLSSTNLD